MADAQPVTLAPLVVPDTDLEGVNADKVFDVTAADVVGYLGRDERSIKHRLLLVHRPGRHLDQLPGHVGGPYPIRGACRHACHWRQPGPFDTYLAVYDSSGKVIASNDDSFQDPDSTIIDLTLPTTGTYYAMVTSSPNSAALRQPLTGDYELFMYTFAAGTTAAIPPRPRPATRCTPARATTRSSPARPTTRSRPRHRTRSSTGRAR